MRNTTPSGYIEFGPANTGHAHIYTDRSNFYFNKQIQVLGGSLINQNDIRSKIFYDKDDTGYYADPASTSVFNIINANTFNGTLNGNITGQARALKIEGFGSSEFTFYQNSGAFEGFSGWHNYLISNHGNGSNYYNTMIAMPFWGPPKYSRRESNVYRGPYDFWTSERTIVSSYNIDAPQFRDYSNTGYYVDPASTSNLYNLQLTGPKHTYLYISPGNGYEAMVRFNGGSGSTWYVGSRTTTQLLGSQDAFHVYSQTRGRTVSGTDNSGNTYSYGSSRAPIFYDLDDTGYYFDGASTSKWSQSNQNGWHTFNNYGLGVTGTYSASRLQLVFAMGSAYRPNSGGTSTQTMYGIGWSHPNAGSLGGANNLTDHGLLIINNGGFKAALSNSLVVISEVRGTLFRDYNSTGYYVDPASTSRLDRINVNGGESYNEFYFRSNKGATSGGLSSPPLQAYSTGNNSAFMSFHKGGY
jgi:hypothetical protein